MEDEKEKVMHKMHFLLEKVEECINMLDPVKVIVAIFIVKEMIFTLY